MQPTDRINDEINAVLATIHYLEDQLTRQRFRLDTLRRLKLYAWSRTRAAKLDDDRPATAAGL